MKAKILLSVIISTLLLQVPYAFAQQAGQDPNALARFQNALKQDGFDVTPGKLDVWNLAADWCAYKPGVDSAWYSNNQPYLQFLVPKPAQEQGEPDIVFQLREDEAVVVIGLTPPPARYFSYTPSLAS